MVTQLKLKLHDDDIEMFCPSCWNDETFTKNPEFSKQSTCLVYVCCGCGFPITAEEMEMTDEQ